MLSGYLKTNIKFPYKPNIYPSPLLSFIKVHKGLICTSKLAVMCFYSAETERSILNHIKLDHSGDTLYVVVPSHIQTSIQLHANCISLSYYPPSCPVVEGLPLTVSNMQRRPWRMFCPNSP